MTTINAPKLKVKELVSCLADVGFEVSAADLQNPTVSCAVPSLGWEAG